LHVPAAARARLRQRGELEATVARWLADAAAADLRVLTPASAQYPARLLHAPLRPLVLFARGDLRALDAHAHRSITIVGSRTPTAYGIAATKDFATACARAGLVIWSGLALGVDGIAHACALAAAAPTVAVLAGGLDAIYPRAHLSLADAVLAGGGLWLSECPPRLRATRGHFPRRNRILALATEAVLVTEAGLASGTMHTAGFAADAGTTVFAVPGAYTSPRSRGCHQLLADGALLAVDPEDLLRSLDVMAPAAQTSETGCSADAIALLRLVEVGPRPEDLLWRESRLDRVHFTRGLLELTQKGLVDVLPGGFVARRLSGRGL
jgi:DNA processing protein